MFEKSLNQVGLSNDESKIYDILLNEGSASAASIIKKSKLKRGLTYKILGTLEAKGIVSKFQKEKKLHFRANHPFVLQEIVDNQSKQVKSQQLNLETLLPQLISSYQESENRPGVRTYPGIEGIKKVYQDTLSEGKEVWSILQVEKIEPKLHQWLDNVYVKNRVKAGIFAKVLVYKGKSAYDYKTRDMNENRETRLFETDQFPVNIEVNIYGNKVAFMVFREGEKNMGIIIENKWIADTMRAMHLLIWNKAGES